MTTKAKAKATSPKHRTASKRRTTVTKRATVRGNEELSTRLHAVATEIAARVETLVTGFGTKTPSQEAETVALLATIRALGADLENPVPAAVMPGPVTES